MANRQTKRGLHTASPAWRAIRRDILQRDRCTCRHCGQYGNQVDHVNGDSHDQRPENLQTLCVQCHSRKTLADARASRKPAIGLDGAPDGW